MAKKTLKDLPNTVPFLKKIWGNMHASTLDLARSFRQTSVFSSVSSGGGCFFSSERNYLLAYNNNNKNE